MNYFGLLLAGIGLLLILGGVAMPATQTHTSTTCVDSSYDPADGCVQTEYTTPNYSKGAFIVFGIALAFGGVFASSILSDEAPDNPFSNQVKQDQTIRDAPDNRESKGLQERIKEQRENEDRSE